MKKWLSLASTIALAACSVDSKDQPTGGVELWYDECPAGVAAVLTDYLSTQVAVLDTDGQPLSESFLSSGSTAASGVAAPLSGDVAAPFSPMTPGEVVLLDRFGTNVITWADAKSAQVRAQLPIGNEFESNPSDYLRVSEQKAYVSRWGENPEPGEEPTDRGGDVLIVDPTTPEITGVIELPREDDLPPRPGSLTPLGKNVLVVLQKVGLDFQTQGPSEIAAIDIESDQVAWHLVLSSLSGCGRVMASPKQAILALGCAGQVDFAGNSLDPDQTGIVLLDANTAPPQEIRRIRIDSELDFTPQSEIAFASEDLILGKTQTPFGGEGNNQLFVIDLKDDSIRVLAEASPQQDGSGAGVVFGSLLCAPGCSDPCFVTDRKSFAVRRFSIRRDLEELEPINLGSDLGLPPNQLGWL